MNQQQSILQDPKIIAWKNTLVEAGCTINTVDPLSTFSKKSGELLFALLKADVETPEGTPLPPIIFIRGNACVVVPLLCNKKTKEEKFLMVMQRRIATGVAVVEFPAGMIDRVSDAPERIALKELEEETGLCLKPEQLHALHSKGLYSSAGACDERIYYFGCVIECDDAIMASFDGRSQNNCAEHEYITVLLKTKEEAQQQISSLQALLGLFLFEEYFGKNPCIV
ncbi:MAG: NUDIX hydrolase [Chitinivibrionales bacterium]|nr:NUDIX hydrolase [Chitinivibrionales bacterium]